MCYSGVLTFCGGWGCWARDRESEGREKSIACVDLVLNRNCYKYLNCRHCITILIFFITGMS